MGKTLPEQDVSLELAVRKMLPDDLDAVMSVEQDSFPAPWSRSAFEDELAQNRLARYLVATAENQIVGYAGTWLVVNEAHVTNVAVDSRFRNRGIGRLLMEQLMELAREEGMESMTLEVRVSNQSARKLYKHLGFIEKGIRRNYYSETKEDALVLWREKL